MMTSQTSSVSLKSPRNGEYARTVPSEHGSSAASLFLQRCLWSTRQKCQRLPGEKGIQTFLVSFSVLIPRKLLLVLWKTILSCCGGFRDLERVKKVSRELAGLTPIPEEGLCRVRVLFSITNYLVLHSHPHQVITVRYGSFP
jgi:hypothetical protein